MNKGNAPSVSNDYGRDLAEHFGGDDATVTSHASYSAPSDSRVDVAEDHLGPNRLKRGIPVTTD